MVRIKVKSSELETAYRHSKTLVSKCEDVGSMVRSVINGMDDSSFSAKAGIMSDLHGISTRLNKQAELMRQYGAIIRTIEDEMQSADSSFGVGSNSIWDGVGRWVGSTAKKILPFSTSSVLGKQNKTASVFLATSSAAIATSVGKIIRDWLKQIFGRIFHNGESSGGTSESTGGASSVTHSGFTNSGIDKVSKLEAMYQSGAKIDASSLDQRISYTDAAGVAKGFYVPENGCTWYASARYRQVNGAGHELMFSKGGGNAADWINNIDRSKFDVFSTSDTSVIKTNTIAVSTTPTAMQWMKDAGGNYINASENHVVYVEAVSDGFVYFSQGSYGLDPSTYGYINKVSVEDFAKDYEYIIAAK